MRSILDRIVNYKKEELESLKRKVSLRDVQLKSDDAEPARSFLGNFKKNEISIIAEIKKASPSGGVLRKDFNPSDLAHQFEDNGASAVSILTDNHFFRGSLDHLSDVKNSVKLPCLRKDFTLDEYHLYEARGAGADAILLIAAILDFSQLKDFNDLANELGMTALMEIHDEKELEKIIAVAPTRTGHCPVPAIIGVNNRDLHTLKTNVETSLNLVKKIPENVCRISESGLKDHGDLVKLQKAGFNGFLIGEALMKEKDVGKKLKEFKCPS